MVDSSHYDKGNQAFAAKDYRQAAVHFKEALKNDPENIKILNRLGSTYYKLRNFPESVNYFNKAIELSPKDKDLIFALGLVHLRAGDRTKALAIYDRLKKIHVDKAEEFYKMIYS